ncbi:MAG: hypothetical protein COB85_00865 [Bacteroidetes bacterium]|nr:MAG: hypothetical protein COB85_00865 [Bacteroidota bacterium]
MNYKLFILPVISAFLLSCGDESGDVTTSGISADVVSNPATASGSGSDITLPKIVFENIVYDFGEIAQGEKVKHSFKFSNGGENTLIISDVSAKCGCTVTSWPKVPIQPGESSEIEVVFSSEGKTGRQAKIITVITNSMPNTTVLKISGNVLTANTD